MPAQEINYIDTPGPDLSDRDLELTLGGRVTAAEAGLLAGQSQQLGWGPKVVCVGDSITAGGAAAEPAHRYSKNWPMEMALASNGQINLPYVHATGGWTSAQALAGLAAVLDAQTPDVVVEMIGTNDSLDGSNTAAPTMANIAAMHALCRERGIGFAMCLLAPQGYPEIPTPSAPTVTVEATGGTMSTSSPQYKIVWVNSTRVTLPSDAATATISSGSTNAVVVTAGYRPDVDGYDVYKSTDGGSTFGRIAQVRGSGQSSYATKYRDTGASPGTAPPGSNTTAVAASATAQRKIAVINASKRAYAQTNKVPLVDMNAALVDPATGLYLLGLGGDGTHPSFTGMKALGERAWTELGPLFRPNRPYGVLYNGDPYNKVQDNAGNSNGMLALGGASSVTGWSIYGGSGSGTSATRGTRTGHNGAALAIARTSDLDIRIVDAAGVAVTAGHVYVFSGVIESVDGDSGSEVTIETKWVGASGTILKLYIHHDLNPTFFQSWPVAAPSGATHVYIACAIGPQAPGTFAISQLTIYDLTAMGLA